METLSSSSQLAGQENGRRLHGTALVAVLVALMLTLLLEALDQTVVGTALPKIIGTLQGFDRYTWAVTAYTLASTTMIPVVGKLSDQFGRKWFLLVGTAIFLIGSALSGASQTMNEFIAFRALQGFGAGVGIALGFVVVADIFPPAERVKWQSLFGVVYGFSNLVGPTLGGWLTDHGPLVGSFVTDTTRWRWVFYLNIPIGIIALVALLIYLPVNISERSNDYTGLAAIRRIDFPGALLSAAATICLLLGLTWGSNATYDWNSLQVIGILATAVILFAAFLITERFAVEPILPLDLFRNRVFAVASILSLLQLMVLVGLLVYLPLFLQGVLGVSATDAGAVITPMTVSSVIGAALAGALISVLKRYRLITIVSAFIMTIGVFLLTQMTPATGLLVAIIFMVIAGIGMGPFFSVLTIAAQNALPATRLGIGTSAVRYVGQLGAVLGVAIVGTVVNNSLASDITKRIPASIAQQLTPAGFKAATSPQVLVNPTYRDTVVQTAQHFAAQNAATHVPPGPQHNQIAATAAAQAMQQAQHILDSVFAALKLSLAFAIQHGLIAVLVFSVAMIVATFFLKDVPMTNQPDTLADEANDEARNVENLSIIP
ncbi:MAG TPA: MDR family MFS transporter [Ktedonobacteraceae bacterium]|nr:MDR family MFS transporter [Ktedonobacteraceae bacterium]